MPTKPAIQLVIGTPCCVVWFVQKRNENANCVHYFCTHISMTGWLYWTTPGDVTFDVCRLAKPEEVDGAP